MTRVSAQGHASQKLLAFPILGISSVYFFFFAAFFLAGSFSSKTIAWAMAALSVPTTQPSPMRLSCWKNFPPRKRPRKRRSRHSIFPQWERQVIFVTHVLVRSHASCLVCGHGTFP